jgi:hypothetical protein
MQRRHIQTPSSDLLIMFPRSRPGQHPYLWTLATRHWLYPRCENYGCWRQVQPLKGTRKGDEVKATSKVHGPTPPLHPFHGIHRWNIGQRSQICSTVLWKISALLADKWSLPYSVVYGYIKARMSIATVCATYLCMCGSQVPTRQISTLRGRTEQDLAYFSSINPSAPLPAQTRFYLLPPKMNSHSTRRPPPLIQSRPLAHSIAMLAIKDTRHSAIWVCIQFDLNWRIQVLTLA